MLWFASVPLHSNIYCSITRRSQARSIPTEFSPVSVQDNPAPRHSSKDPVGKGAEMLLALDSPFKVGRGALTSP